MTNDYEMADDNRADLIYGKDKLLAPLQPGMAAPPHPMAPGSHRRRLLPGQHQRHRSDIADPGGARRERRGRRFWVLGAIAVAGAIGVVAAPKAVYSALFLASTMIALAVIYVAQDALFLGVVQVVVYTGAVMMLFLFVLMLIGVDSAESLVETIRGQRVAADRWRAWDSGSCSSPASAPRLGGHRLHRTRPRPTAGRQRRGPGRADLHPLPVGVRTDQRAADHRGTRRDGAGPPGTLRARARPSANWPSNASARRRPRHPDAQPRRVRPAQRRRHRRPGCPTDRTQADSVSGDPAHRRR